MRQDIFEGTWPRRTIGHALIISAQWNSAKDGPINAPLPVRPIQQFAQPLAQFPLGRRRPGKIGRGVETTLGREIRRRHELVHVDELDAESESVGLRLTFMLPAGSYATVLLREVMKGAIGDDGEDPEEKRD